MMKKNFFLLITHFAFSCNTCHL